MVTQQDIEAALAKVTEARKGLDSLLEQWVAENSPVKVGDRMVWRGYTHLGKPAIAIRVLPSHSSYRSVPRVYVLARIVRKDGSTSDVLTSHNYTVEELKRTVSI